MAPTLPSPVLRFVHNEQHPALLAHPLDEREVAGRRLQYARRAEDGLGDKGGERAGGLGVYHVEAELRAGVVARGEGHLQRAAVAVGRGYGHAARHPGAVAAAGVGEGDRERPAGVAVVALHQPHHFVAAGEHLGHLQGNLGGLAAVAEEHHLLELRRQKVGEGLGELDHLFADQVGVQVEDALGAALQRLGDGGVVVADAGGHLAGAEVQVLLAVRVDEGRAPPASDDGLAVVAGGSEQVGPGLLQQGGFSGVF